MLEKIESTVEFLKQEITTTVEIGIILGSGLNELANDMTIQHSFPYKSIPHFPISTVEGHAGNLLFGTLNGVAVMAMQGRFHYYEGYTMQEVTFPIRVMKAMGVKTLILSNAAGGMNPTYRIGDIVLITDHINMFPANPLRGRNENRLGARFPDMSEVYTPKLIALSEQIAREQGIRYHKGVYVGVQGPAFETPAEYRMFRVLGGDCVGMSTVPEAMVARHSAMQCVAFSVITDLGIADRVEKVSHAEVMKAAKAAEPTLRRWVHELVKGIAETKNDIQ
jgi:purine-nucleoside phosphorylase